MIFQGYYPIFLIEEDIMIYILRKFQNGQIFFFFNVVRRFILHKSI